MTFETVLENPLWSAGVVRASRSEQQLFLNTIPGVVGGEFHAELCGIETGLEGIADVSLTCTSWDNSSKHSRKSTSPDTHFYEIEKVEIKHSKIDIRFLIPFETKGTEENAIWRLVVDLPNGVSETFEVPICRTDESNPEVNAIQIASYGLGIEESEELQRPSSSNENLLHSGTSRHVFRSGNAKPYQMQIDEGALNLRIPGHVPGRPSFFKGGLIITLLWVTFCGLVAWLIDEGIEPYLIAVIPGALFAALTAFARFGVTVVDLNQKELTVRYTLFGIGWTKRIQTGDIGGFKPCCVGKLPTKDGGQISYAMMVEDKASNSSFLGAGLVNQSESRVLSKELNAFLDSVR